MIKVFNFSYISANIRTKKTKLLSENFLENLISAKSIGDIYLLLSGTDYGRYIASISEEDFYTGIEKYFLNVFTDIQKNLNKKEANFLNLFFLERRYIEEKKASFKQSPNYEFFIKKIDLDFIKKIKKSIESLSYSDRADIKRIVGSYFDLQNIITIVKLRVIYDLPPEEIIPFLIPYGYIFSLKELSQLVNFSKLDEFSLFMNQKIEISFKDFTSFRKGIYDYHLTQLKKIWYGNPFRFSLPLSFLRLLEIEIKNIKGIYEGVKYALPQEEIRNMVIGL